MTNYEAEAKEYEALMNTPEAQAVLQAEEWPPLRSVPVPPAFDPEWLPPKRVVKDFLIKFTEKPQKSARSTSMLLTLRWVRLLASA